MYYVSHRKGGKGEGKNADDCRRLLTKCVSFSSVFLFHDYDDDDDVCKSLMLIWPIADEVCFVISVCVSFSMMMMICVNP